MSHGFVTVEDKHGRWWRNVRAHRWWGRDHGWQADIGGQWVHFDRDIMRLSIKVSTSGEETLDVHYGFGPVAQHWWNVTMSRPVTVECRPGEACTPACRYCSGHGRRTERRQVRLWPRFRFTIDLGLTGVRWCFGDDPHSWERDASILTRLRRNDLTWFRVSWYRRTNETVATVDAAMPLPEGPAPVTVTLERSTWGVQVGPYSRTRRSKNRLRLWLPGFRRVRYGATVESVAGIPVPGKGENSWDCGQDSYSSISVHVTAAPYDEHDSVWVGQAIASAQETIYRDRSRYGRDFSDTGAT